MSSSTRKPFATAFPPTYPAPLAPNAVPPSNLLPTPHPLGAQHQHLEAGPAVQGRPVGQARRRAGLLRVGRTSKAPRGVERVVRKVQRKLERGGGLWHYSACSNAFRVRFVAFKRTLATRTRWGGLRRANSGAIKRYRAPTAPTNDRARSSRKLAQPAQTAKTVLIRAVHALLRLGWLSINTQ